ETGDAEEVQGARGSRRREGGDELPHRGGGRRHMADLDGDARTCDRRIGAAQICTVLGPDPSRERLAPQDVVARDQAPGGAPPWSCALTIPLRANAREARFL